MIDELLLSATFTRHFASHIEKKYRTWVLY
jgi:hypothetical protein